MRNCSFQLELSSRDRFVFRGGRSVIPDTFLEDILQRIYSSHLSDGECTYWQGTNVTHTDIYCKNVTLLAVKIAKRPWAKIAHNCSDLITLDYYSNFCEISPLKYEVLHTKQAKGPLCETRIPDIVICAEDPKDFQQDKKKLELEMTNYILARWDTCKACRSAMRCKRLMMTGNSLGQIFTYWFCIILLISPGVWKVLHKHYSQSPRSTFNRHFCKTGNQPGKVI